MAPSQPTLIDPPADEYVSMVGPGPGAVVMVGAVADVGGVVSGEVGGVFTVVSGAGRAVVDGEAPVDGPVDGTVVAGVGEVRSGGVVPITF